jgi:hypothetical protein
MGQADRSHIQHEIENEANKLFPGSDTPGRVAVTRRRTDDRAGPADAQVRLRRSRRRPRRASPARGV